MKNNNGQALVEFIIVLPIFLLLILSILDIGNIMYKKYSLETKLSFVTDLYKNNKLEEIQTYCLQNDIKVSYIRSDIYTTIIVEEEVKITTPGLNKILGNPYKIESEVVIYNE